MPQLKDDDAEGQAPSAAGPRSSCAQRSNWGIFNRLKRGAAGGSIFGRREQGLVDGLVRNAHGFIVGEVDLQSLSDLFGRPAIDPFAITATWFVATLERRLSRAGNLTATSVTDLASQSVLNVLVQP